MARSYSKNELAQAYAPDIAPASARNRLAHWIRHNSALHRALLEAGYHPAQQIFTPLQVEIIFRYLGEP
jgi:hypothetical protein